MIMKAGQQAAAERVARAANMEIVIISLNIIISMIISSSSIIITIKLSL